MTDTLDTPEARVATLRTLHAAGLTFHDAVQVFGMSDAASPHVAHARRHLAREGELEVDEVAVVSDGNDGGAYVQAWLWVPDGEAGVRRDAQGAILAVATR